MTTESEGTSPAPVPATRVADELKKLSLARRNGQLEPDEYEHRFSRMISELRDRKIAGSRAEIMAVLAPLRDQATVDAADWTRFVKQLGLG